VSDFDGFVVDSDEVVGTGGFLAIRRLKLRNLRSDGSVSAQYTNDLIVRPYGQDAVAVVIYARTNGISVLLRDGLRPSIPFGRDASRAPLPEAPPRPFTTEIVAGILEDHDIGEAGLRTRAAAEVLEEAGFTVDPANVVLLGAGALPSAGSLTEKVYFTAVEVDPATQQPLGGDGSPMEEAATTRWMPLEAAISACYSGDIHDLKTELGLRRLRDALAC
jgi:ADP-ribose pyrophosphatase